MYENLDDQCLLETWYRLELREAIRHGYEILEVYEVYHFGKTSRIFKQFVNMFLKLKQEASGFPSLCFVEDSSVHDEGIELDRDSMVPNEGSRTVAKAILNSLWGKFGQNENVYIQYVKSYNDLLALTKNKHYKTTLFDFVSEECIRVAATLKDSSIRPLKTGNVIIVSFVMCYSRFEIIECVGKDWEKSFVLRYRFCDLFLQRR